MIVKKVLGTENPSDVFTKHSLTAERSKNLVEIHGCTFRTGRAENAPLTRQGENSKVKISEADDETLHITDCNLPRVPHVELDKNKIDELYPSLEPVDDLPLEDLRRFEDSFLYDKGMETIKQIFDEMSSHGRVRKPIQNSE